MKRVLLGLVLAAFAAFVVPAIPDIAVAATATTVNTDIDVATEQISSTFRTDCYRGVVCAEATNISPVCISTVSANACLSGFKLYPLPASGEVCRYVNAAPTRKANMRDLYAHSLYANSRINLTCEY